MDSPSYISILIYSLRYFNLRYRSPMMDVITSASGKDDQIPIIPIWDRMIAIGMINTTPLSNIIIEAILEFSIEVKNVDKTILPPAKKSPINMILKPCDASWASVVL